MSYAIIYLTNKVVILITNIVIKKGMIVMNEQIGELAIPDNENECYDDEGSKSLLWIIVLFLIFRQVFSSIFLALIIAYILAPRKKDNDRQEE